MSFKTWHIYGYGIKVTDIPIKDETLPRLKKMISLAPNYERYMAECFADQKIDDPQWDDYMDTDTTFSLGLPTIMKEVIEEVEHIVLCACDDFIGDTYLLYSPSYPWNITEHEKDLTEEGLNSMFSKYINMLTDEVIDITDYGVENGG